MRLGMLLSRHPDTRPAHLLGVVTPFRRSETSRAFRVPAVGPESFLSSAYLTRSLADLQGVVSSGLSKIVESLGAGGSSSGAEIAPTSEPGLKVRRTPVYVDRGRKSGTDKNIRSSLSDVTLMAEEPGHGQNHPYRNLRSSTFIVSQSSVTIYAGRRGSTQTLV